MNKRNDLINIKHNVLNFYCINHRCKSNVIKNIQKYNIKKEDEFQLIENHSAECQININIKKKFLKENSINVYKLSNLRNEL